MPHPIPANPATIEGWRYFLVAIPDDDVAVSAAWSIYSELMNNWAWGLEGIEDDSAAMAQVWAEALFETIRIRTMGFPDDVLTYIDEIEGKLDDLIAKPCCDNSLYETVVSGDGVVQPIENTEGSDIIRGDGDPPGGVADWPTYDELLCQAALNYANNLHSWVLWMEVFDNALLLGYALVLGGLVAGLASTGIGIAAAVGAIGVYKAIGLLEELSAIFDLEPDYDQAEAELQDPDTIAEIACAIILSSTPAAAESAVDAVLSELAPEAAPLFAPWPLRFTMNKIFNMESDAGGYGGAECPDCSGDPGPFEFANSGINASGTYVTVNEVSPTEYTYAHDRPDTAADNSDFHVWFNYDMPACADNPSQATVDFVIRISGWWYTTPHPNVGQLNLMAMHSRSASNCPAADIIPAARTNTSKQLLDKDGTPFSYELRHTFTVNAGDDYFGVGVRFAEETPGDFNHVTDADITVELLQVNVS